MRKLKINLFALLLIPVLVLSTQCQMEDPIIDPDPVDESPTDDEDPSDGENEDEEPTDSLINAACSECDYVVQGYLTDGEALNIRPGMVIGLDGSKQYDRLLFRNIVGTPDNPVIIRNCGGQAEIYSRAGFGIKFEDSKYFKIVGDGSTSHEYGIKISAEAGFYLTMEHFTTNFEIAHIEIAGPRPNGIGTGSGFAGIGVKTSPYQDCDLFRDPSRRAWIMEDVIIRHNYIHDTGGEGIYMGHGFYKGRVERYCSSMTYSHSIQGVRIYDNLIENVGFDGIQIKNADKDVEVYNNVIRNYGQRQEGVHNEGLFIGEGTTGKFYNNIIDTGYGNGCMIQGLGDLDIYNNIFINSGENGFYITHGAYVVRKPDGYFNIFNNTVVNADETGFVFYNTDGGPKRFINNIVVNANTPFANGAGVEMSNNIFANNPSEVGFVSVSSGDLHLSVGSAAIDAGADLSAYGIVDDYEGNQRPQGQGYDIGAYEN